MKLEAPAETYDIPFVNEERLNWRHWLIAIVLIVIALWATPRVWKHLERFHTNADYRIPYSLSRDYWLYEWRLEKLEDINAVFLMGDSVIWGEYVLPNGTLSHFLNAQSHGAERFVNAGVNGLFPLALGGLIDDYAEPIRNRRVLVNCNLLWMSSPKADLQIQKEERFNHSRLVPQFLPNIPCYKANANERLSVIIERNIQFMSWVTHLQSTYYNDKSIPQWTLADDGNDPPNYTNSYKNPLSQITMEVPLAPEQDPLRGPESSRHKSWNSEGSHPTSFEWVTLESSLQWAAFKKSVELLKSRGNDVLVLLGPFNEHMIVPENRAGYVKLRDGVKSWFAANDITCIAPDPLPSNLYADASHPLTEGYEKLAGELFSNPLFQRWLQSKSSSKIGE